MNFTALPKITSKQPFFVSLIPVNLMSLCHNKKTKQFLKVQKSGQSNRCIGEIKSTADIQISTLIPLIYLLHTTEAVGTICLAQQPP